MTAGRRHGTLSGMKLEHSEDRRIDRLYHPRPHIKLYGELIVIGGLILALVLGVASQRDSGPDLTPCHGSRVVCPDTRDGN